MASNERPAGHQDDENRRHGGRRLRRPGQASDILIGTADQIAGNLERLAEAGSTMPLVWPPFQDVPVSKTLDHLERLEDEIMPKVEAI